MKIVKAALFALLGAVSATNVHMESRPALPAAWSMTGPAARKATMIVHAMMKHKKEDVKRLEQILMDVSDPRSDKYGQHLSLEEVGQVTPISDEDVALVKAYFGGAVDFKLTPNKDILTIELEVEQIESLFSTKVEEYEHANGVKLLRAQDYSLPKEIADRLYSVADLTMLPRLKTETAKLQVAVGAGKGNWTNDCDGLAGCKGWVTPGVLKERYSVDGTGMDNKNNSMAIAEFQFQYFKQSDIDLFSKSCHVNANVDTIIGGNLPIVGVESELDIEYIKGVSPEIPLTLIYSSTFSLVDWMTDINGRADAEPIQSVSYGNDEAQQTGADYMFACNVQFMKAGARGISVLFASGDQGVCGREGCSPGARYNPDFPAGSPYITAVGGTDFVNDFIGDEAVWPAGGGGFSDTFDIPEYQAEAVAAYKADPAANLPAQNKWNNTGRGYPDVSALGGQKAPYCVVARGAAAGVAGTSAACPVAAAIFARLNGLRLNAAKPVLGFLNPFIYQNADAFNDVTVGVNDANGGQGGFQAIKGWDAATGVGTLNYAKLATRV